MYKGTIVPIPSRRG